MWPLHHVRQRLLCKARLPQKLPRLQPLVLLKWVVDLLNPTFHRGSRIRREAGQMLTYPFEVNTQLNTPYRISFLSCFCSL